MFVLASTALAACGGDDGNGDGTEGTNTKTVTSLKGDHMGGAAPAKSENIGDQVESVVRIEVDPNGRLAYTTTKETAKAGIVRISLKNPQSALHDLRLKDQENYDFIGTDVIGKGEDDIPPLEMEPGRYLFYCSLPKHNEAGMEGTLIVR